MIDTMSPSERSERMRRVRNRDTKPELAVRRVLHHLGYRYRLHGKHLPGRPDIVFGGRKKVIFVHGCFWHRHDDPQCKLARMPKSRLDFWGPKLRANHLRDVQNKEKLAAAGWKSLVVWECELAKKEELQRKLTKFLGVRNAID